MKEYLKSFFPPTEQLLALNDLGEKDYRAVPFTNSWFGGTHKLSEVSKEKIVLSTQKHTYVIPITLMLGGILMLGVGLAFLLKGGWTFLIPAGIFLIGGGVFLKPFFKVFDKSTNFYISNNKDVCSLDDIQSLQILKHLTGSISTSNLIISYQLNLVLKDQYLQDALNPLERIVTEQKRINVLDHINRKEIFYIANKLSSFLKVPVVDLI